MHVMLRGKSSSPATCNWRQTSQNEHHLCMDHSPNSHCLLNFMYSLVLSSGRRWTISSETCLMGPSWFGMPPPRCRVTTHSHWGKVVCIRESGIVCFKTTWGFMELGMDSRVLFQFYLAILLVNYRLREIMCGSILPTLHPGKLEQITHCTGNNVFQREVSLDVEAVKILICLFL